MLPDEFEQAMWINGQSSLAIRTFMKRTKANNSAAITAFQLIGFGSKGIFDQTWTRRVGRG